MTDTESTTPTTAVEPAASAVVAEPPRSALEEFMAEMGGARPVGTEAVSGDDMALPVIKINHENGVFEDSLSGKTYTELDCVMLGLLKQRVLWDVDLNNSSGPMCKSLDANVGHPRENFPWGDFEATGGAEAAGSTSITCETCPFAQWGSHPKNDTPWCTAQYTFPIVIGGGDAVSGLLTLQRSALTPTRRYITAVTRDGIPFFAHNTKITLEGNKNGSVKFYVPKFTRGEPINDASKFRAWAKQFEQIRGSVRSADLTSGTDVVVTSPATGGSTDGSAPTASAEPAF